jgi:hypothetical protein
MSSPRFPEEIGMLRIELTYCRATKVWAVWFVPREPSWEPDGLWKLLGSFDDVLEAMKFLAEMTGTEAP